MIFARPVAPRASRIALIVASVPLFTNRTSSIDRTALHTSREQHVVKATSTGVLTRLDAYDIGIAAWRLGAGRARKEDPVQAGAGVELHAKPGDTVTAGQPLLTLHTDTPERFEYALQAVEGSYDIAAPGTPFTPSPVVRERIA